VGVQAAALLAGDADVIAQARMDERTAAMGATPD
jgi:hypothetical protein